MSPVSQTTALSRAVRHRQAGRLYIFEERASVAQQHFPDTMSYVREPTIPPLARNLDENATFAAPPFVRQRFAGVGPQPYGGVNRMGNLVSADCPVRSLFHY